MEFSCIRTKPGFTERLNVSGAAYLKKFYVEEFWFQELRN